MASTGSRRQFTYTDDENLEWNMSLDESIYETGALGFGQDISAAAQSNGRYLKASNRGLPLEPRYILCTQQDGDTPGRKQKFFVGRNDATPWGGAKIVVVEGVTYAITAKIGEKRFSLPTVDTGLLDGDQDDQVAVAVP